MNRYINRFIDLETERKIKRDWAITAWAIAGGKNSGKQRGHVRHYVFPSSPFSPSLLPPFPSFPPILLKPSLLTILLILNPSLVTITSLFSFNFQIFFSSYLPINILLSFFRYLLSLSSSSLFQPLIIFRSPHFHTLLFSFLLSHPLLEETACVYFRFNFTAG